MPSAESVKRSFQLDAGDAVGGFLLESSEVGYAITKINESEEFPTKVTLALPLGTTADAALSAFQEHVKDSHILYSEYGNPYTVSYAAPALSAEAGKAGTVMITCLATAVRRHDLPRLSDVAKEERAAKGIPTVFTRDEEDGTLGEDYRVMKANFSGATCPLCGQPIVPGDIISRLIASQGPAHEGWSHTACLIAKLKQEQAAS